MKVIGWKGSFDAPCVSLSTPRNWAFADHFGILLNHTDENTDIKIPSSIIYVPVLDDHLTPGEIIDETCRMKPQKATGSDSVLPGILKMATRRLHYPTNLYHDPSVLWHIPIFMIICKNVYGK